MPQLGPMVEPSFQMPQPQGMEQLAPVTPDMVQASGGTFGELLARLQYLVCVALSGGDHTAFHARVLQRRKPALGDLHAASQTALTSQACGAPRHLQ